MVKMEGPSLMIMKAISTNNSNYMSLLFEMWQSRQCCFYWIHYVDRHFILSFISYSLWPKWTCINWQLHLMLLFSICGLDIIWSMFFLLVHAHVWPQWEVRIFGKSCTVAEVASLHRDQKFPFTSCVISSWEVLISYRASDTSYLDGRLTCEGIFRLDSSNECSTQAITWPTLHMEEEKSHLSFCDFHFHLCSLHSLFSVSLFSLLEIITSHVRSPVGWRGRNVSHCLLSFWLSKWHRISSYNCLPFWHYNYP